MHTYVRNTEVIPYNKLEWVDYGRGAASGWPFGT
jgi:hypothetical protein